MSNKFLLYTVFVT